MIINAKCMNETFPETFKELDKVQMSVFLTANLLITSSRLRFLVLWMCNKDKFDNLSSPIVALIKTVFYAAHHTK